jgi:protoporphyrinogen oxidase
MDTTNIDTLILGAGLTGLSTAYHLADSCIVLEAKDYVGGLAHTFHDQGHSFDITGHWLHLRSDEAKALVDRVLGDQMLQRARKARVFSAGVYTHYPYQANTHGLPADIAAECVLGFLKARCVDRLSTKPEDVVPGEAKTFADFILQRMGEGIAKHFMFPYNQKLWTVHPRDMDASWCSRFVPVPSIEDVVLGAFGLSPQALGYNTHFLYPRAGGIARLPQAIAAHVQTPMQLNDAVVGIDLNKRVVTTQKGRSYHYQQLVNTLPLKHFMHMCAELPTAIVDAAVNLRHTTLSYFDVAAKGANPEQPHWCYVPEPEQPFYRIGSFSAVETNMAAPAQRNFYVEYSYQGSELPLANAEELAIKQLLHMRLIDKVDDVIFIKQRQIPVAYVLPGAEVEPARQALLGYLDERKVLSTGRYGAWVYAAMEDALLDGMQADRWVRDQRQNH